MLIVLCARCAGADPLNPSSQGPPASLTSDPEILSLLSQSTPRPSAGLPPYASPYGHPHHHQHQPPYLGGGPNGAGGEMYFSGGGYSPYPYGMYGMGPPPPLMGGMGYPGGPHPHMMQQQQVVPAGEEQQGGAREAEQKERVEGPEGEAGSIPPPDISKTIPCKSVSTLTIVRMLSRSSSRSLIDLAFLPRLPLGQVLPSMQIRHRMCIPASPSAVQQPSSPSSSTAHVPPARLQHASFRSSVLPISSQLLPRPSWLDAHGSSSDDVASPFAVSSA
jgi:hypothetical protein